MKKRLITITMILVYLAGFLFLSYPEVNRFINYQSVMKSIKEFRIATTVNVEEKQTVLADLKTQMEQYNAEIFENGQKNLSDPWAYEVSSFDLQEYGLESDMIAVISIPSMELELPVYLGASSKNMSRGAVHLSQTSLPIGGENTNSVIAAHRGYKGIPMFREIEKVKTGDKVFITNPWETLTYQVVDIEVIYPNEVEKVLIQENRDMLTLLTCYPYLHNTHRYVVYCERVREEAESADQGEEIQVDAEIIFGENAENVRREAMTTDEKALNEETMIKRVGYVLYLLIGIAIAVSLFVPKKKKEEDEKISSEEVKNENSDQK